MTDTFRNDIILPLINQRKRHALSQSALDEILGTTRGQVGKWECGDRKPSAFLLSCWVDALKCRIVIFEDQKNPESCVKGQRNDHE